MSSSSIALTTSIVLDAQGNPNAVFVFYATASTITQAAAATITLANGAQANNVYWINGSSFTSLAGAATIGNILAHTSVTLGGGTLNGRALANTGAVTMSTQTVITVPSGSSGKSYNYNGQTFPSEVSLVAFLVDCQNNAVAASEYYADNFVWVGLCPPPLGTASKGYLRTNNAQRSSVGPNSSPQGAYNAAVVVLGTPYGQYDADIVITANAVVVSVSSSASILSRITALETTKTMPMIPRATSPPKWESRWKLSAQLSRRFNIFRA